MKLLINDSSSYFKDSVTVYFADDETLQGKFAKKPDDEPQEDKGNWSVEADGNFESLVLKDDMASGNQVGK